ncbi:MAG: translation initiation factor [bacterium]
MGNKGKKVTADGAGFGGSLGDLLRAQGLAPAAPATEPAPAPEPAPEPGAGLAALPRIVLRRTRKGHGGRTVTLIEKLEPLPAPEREAIARALRSALGTGARVEGDAIVVQGDVADRLTPWLTARGARKIITS